MRLRTRRKSGTGTGRSDDESAGYRVRRSLRVDVAGDGRRGVWWRRGVEGWGDAGWLDGKMGRWDDGFVVG